MPFKCRVDAVQVAGDFLQFPLMALAHLYHLNVVASLPPPPPPPRRPPPPSLPPRSPKEEASLGYFALRQALARSVGALNPE